jgi:hypothetical protein
MKRLLGYNADGKPIYYDHRKARSFERRTRFLSFDERFRAYLKWIDKEMEK